MSESTSVSEKSERPENGAVPNIHLSEVSRALTESESPPSTPDTPRYIEDDGFGHEEPPVGEIERDLDTLTLSGSTINDLEIQLTRAKQLYQQSLGDSRRVIEGLRRKLNSHIRKSEPFIEIWRKARQAQEESNKAAMRFDKANSQHAASKEMIHMAESQLASRATEGVDPGSPSPLDQAWQEMLNHATRKVVETEKELRFSELEHRAVLEKVKRVMEEYRSTERRLRTHIVKSRPYYEERFRANQRLQQLRQRVEELERKIDESKRMYTSTLRKLEQLNTEIHHRRANSQIFPRIGHAHPNPRLSSSTGSSPRLQHKVIGEAESLDSVRVPEGFSGSVGSLPSIGTSSVSDSTSPTPPLTVSTTSPTPPLTLSPLELTNRGSEENCGITFTAKPPTVSPSQQIDVTGNGENPVITVSDSTTDEESPVVLSDGTVNEENPVIATGGGTENRENTLVSQPLELLAHELVSRCLTAAVHTVAGST